MFTRLARLPLACFREVPANRKFPVRSTPFRELTTSSTRGESIDSEFDVRDDPEGTTKSDEKPWSLVAPSRVGAPISTRGLKLYEAAVRKGFVGTYDEYRFHHTRSSRTHGGILKTLCLEKALTADQFFRFRRTAANSDGICIHRTLLLHGTRLGMARLYIASHVEQELCPYFDPITRTLRFRKRNGQDLEEYYGLADMAQMVRRKPLLLMAHAEGLLDSIPDAALSSLDLQTNLEAGYHAGSTIAMYRGWARPQTTPGYNLLHGLRAGFRLRVFVDNAPERRTIRSFPYIDENQRLRVWDVGKEEPLRVVGRGIVDGGLPPEIVRKRFPAFFGWAQDLGYWKDVK